MTWFILSKVKMSWSIVWRCKTKSATITTYLLLRKQDSQQTLKEKTETRVEITQSLCLSHPYKHDSVRAFLPSDNRWRGKLKYISMRLLHNSGRRCKGRRCKVCLLSHSSCFQHHSHLSLHKFPKRLWNQRAYFPLPHF